ncbi:hypothetical protein BS78_10G080300 [Paspalum vaginatum]|nr:hypothetical protein BS78_10G080300 [Paspalum vaginatum]
MDAAGDTDTAGQGAGVDDAASYDIVTNDDRVAQGGGGGRGAPPPVTTAAAVVAISRMKRLGPRVPRPKLRRAVVRPAGSDHGVRRTKEFLQWREWYLRKQRREKEEELLYYVGIPSPAGSWT